MNKLSLTHTLIKTMTLMMTHNDNHLESSLVHVVLTFASFLLLLPEPDILNTVTSGVSLLSRLRLTFRALTWSVVAAAALLAEASEQRGDIISQDAAAVLYEEANQLAHLGEKDDRIRASPHSLALLRLRKARFCSCLCWGKQPKLSSNSASSCNVSTWTQHVK